MKPDVAFLRSGDGSMNLRSMTGISKLNKSGNFSLKLSCSLRAEVWEFIHNCFKFLPNLWVLFHFSLKLAIYVMTNGLNEVLLRKCYSYQSVCDLEVEVEIYSFVHCCCCSVRAFCLLPQKAEFPLNSSDLHSKAHKHRIFSNCSFHTI